MTKKIKEILDNIKKYQFQLLTSTGLGHEYFYCYGDDRFENWLKRKNIKYKIVKSDLLDYITNLQEENERLKELADKYEEEHNNEFQCWKRDRKELLDRKAKMEKAFEFLNYIQNLQEENERLNNIIEEKKIPEKLDNYADVSGDLAYAWSFAEKN